MALAKPVCACELFFFFCNYIMQTFFCVQTYQYPWHIVFYCSCAGSFTLYGPALGVESIVENAHSCGTRGNNVLSSGSCTVLVSTAQGARYCNRKLRMVTQQKAEVRIINEGLEKELCFFLGGFLIVYCKALSVTATETGIHVVERLST